MQIGLTGPSLSIKSFCACLVVLCCLDSCVHFAQHPDLVQIDLHECEAVTAKGLLRLVKGCPKLLPDQVVSTIKNDTFCAVVSKLHPELVSINLAGCKAVTNSGVASIASRCTQLTSLDLTDCDAVTDKGLATLATACSQLLPDKVLSKAKGNLFCNAVAKQHPDLESINLQGCKAVSDKGLEALAFSCRQLLPNKVFSKAKGNLFCIAVAKQHPELAEIDLTRCKAVTDKGLAALAYVHTHTR